MQTIHPRNGYLHVKLELKKQPLIHVPDSAETGIEQIITVLATNPECKLCQSGDKVYLFESVTPIGIPNRDKTEALVHESAVVAVVTDNP